VLFVAVDDMNDWVGCLGGHPDVRTPNIDRLAGRGVLFTNAHCASPVCNPSRTAVMTGLRPSTTGVYHNGHWWRPALPEVVTLPQHFMTAGYRVLGGGKVYHHPPGFNPPNGWHEYFDQVFDDPWHRPKAGSAVTVRRPRWPPGFPLNGLDKVTDVPGPINPMEFDWGPLDKSDLQMGDGQTVAWACRVLSQQHRRPLFLAAGTFRPHLPWYTPRKYFDLYPLSQVTLPPVKAGDLDDVPPAGVQLATARQRDFQLIRHTKKWREAVQAYLASISYADALVGRLLDALDRSPRAENTIIVLWSDHGWHLGEKGHWHKMTLWERATRVPLIVVAPGVGRPGTRCSRPVSLVDLYPTLNELCGLPLREELDGTSLVPLLRDPSAPWNRPALITYRRGNHALRSDHWRYIRYANGDEELYDHRRDPNEWTNLAGRAEFAHVRRELTRWLPTEDTPDVPEKSAYEFDVYDYTWIKKPPVPR
jgi:arylsulfatase A-like enzyme